MPLSPMTGVVKVVIPNSTTPLKEYIEKIKSQNQEGLITKISRQNQAYFNRIFSHKSPMQQYISNLLQKKKIQSSPSHKSNFIDIKG